MTYEGRVDAFIYSALGERMRGVFSGVGTLIAPFHYRLSNSLTQVFEKGALRYPILEHGALMGRFLGIVLGHRVVR